MPVRTEHGKARPQTPRLKDQPPTFSEPTPTRHQPRDRGGRFASGPGLGRRGLPAPLKRALGTEAGSLAEQTYRDTLLTFKTLLAELPASDSPAVQALIASQARALVLSAHYATAAVNAGLATPEGLRLLDASTKLDARAERLAVTARDVAERTFRGRSERAPTDQPSFLRAAPVARQLGEANQLEQLPNDTTLAH